MRLVFFGLSLSSSWGNGHATTYRALIKALARRGHDVLFLEWDAPWYRAHRDLVDPPYCRLAFYDQLDEIDRWSEALRAADAVVIGSYVHEGPALIRRAQALTHGALAFYDIDTPVTLSKLASGEQDYLAPALIPAFDVYFSFTGGPTLARLEADFGARHAVALYCSADPELYTPRLRPTRWDLSYLATYSEDRQPALERLLIEPARALPHLRFVVAGPQYPDTIVWPSNVERLAHCAPQDHPDFYAASRFTLNLTRADMVRAGHSPSVRLFEAASCAAAVISDPWPGLDAFFTPGEDILVARQSSDVVEALTTLPQERRASIGTGARARFLARHTSDHRAQTLESHLAEASLARRSKARSIAAEA